ncbi:MAG: flagellar assembly protein FliW [Roseburia sp.]|nr:flagellar assembly protein FliW [Roseburia sp.]
MLVKTKYFGEINLSEDKIITMERGMFGFEEYKKYTILYDSEKEGRPNVSWFQSVEEPSLAFSVINPMAVMEDYNPIVEDELLKGLGEITEENIVVLLPLTVPQEITNMTANLKAPIIINADTRKGAQVVVENEEYEIKYKIYDILKGKKEA